MSAEATAAARPGDDTAVYRTCMEKVRERTTVIKAVLAGAINTGSDVLNTELICLQFRKTLELIAYASLAANREKYAEAHANFGLHWRAKDMLKTLEKVNQDFYPMPLGPPIPQPDGTKHFPRPADGYLTKDEFAFLYDTTSEYLHMRNPFSPKDSLVHTPYSVDGWVTRIRNLLAWHLMHLVDGGKWVVQIPATGPIHLFPATPTAGQSALPQ
jgi:hypothetical protein